MGCNIQIPNNLKHTKMKTFNPKITPESIIKNTIVTMILIAGIMALQHIGFI